MKKIGIIIASICLSIQILTYNCVSAYADGQESKVTITIYGEQKAETSESYVHSQDKKKQVLPKTNEYKNPSYATIGGILLLLVIVGLVKKIIYKRNGE